MTTENSPSKVAASRTPLNANRVQSVGSGLSAAPSHLFDGDDQFAEAAQDVVQRALYRHEIERLSDAAPTLLKQTSAEKALEKWLTRYASLIAAKRGLKEAVPSIFEAGADAYAYSRDRMTAAVTLLLDAAANSGAIRSDFDPQDVLLAVAASTWTFVNDGDWEERTLRVLRLVMDGLRYKPR